MDTIGRQGDGAPENMLDGVARRDDDEASRSGPPWAGFRGGRLITLTKMRRDARSTAFLALLILAATMAVLGAAHLGAGGYDVGSLLGFDLRASQGTP